MAEVNTEFLFTIALEIQVFSLGDTPYGSRRIFYFDAGSFDGPKLKGTVLPGGGGSSRIRRDDALEVDVQLILETDDKHQIYMAWKDFAMVRRRSWTAFIAARSSTREPTICASEKYGWMNRICAIATGSLGANARTLDVFQVL